MISEFKTRLEDFFHGSRPEDYQDREGVEEMDLSKDEPAAEEPFSGGTDGEDVSSHVEGEIYPEEDPSSEVKETSRENASEKSIRRAAGQVITPFCLILDLSDSMRFPAKKRPIDALNQSLPGIREAVMKVLAASNSVYISVVFVHDEEADLVTDFMPIKEWAPPLCRASGRTPMGDGIIKGVQAYQRLVKAIRKTGDVMTQGIFVIMTDGKATDEMDTALDLLHGVQFENGHRRLSIWAVGTEGADQDLLCSIASDEQKVVRLKSAQEYEALFRDIGASVSAVSSAGVSPDRTVLAYSYGPGRDEARQTRFRRGDI